MLVAVTPVSGLIFLSLLTCLSLTACAPGSPLDQEWTNYVDSPQDVDFKPVKSTVSLKGLLKALFRFNLLRKSEFDGPSTSGVLAASAATSERTSSAEDDATLSTSPPLVDDTPDLWLIPGQLERDKSHKFTHSFRFGYGAPH